MALDETELFLSLFIRWEEAEFIKIYACLCDCIWMRAYVEIGTYLYTWSLQSFVRGRIFLSTICSSVEGDCAGTLGPCIAEAFPVK